MSFWLGIWATVYLGDSRRQQALYRAEIVWLMFVRHPGRGPPQFMETAILRFGVAMSYWGNDMSLIVVVTQNMHHASFEESYNLVLRPTTNGIPEAMAG